MIRQMCFRARRKGDLLKLDSKSLSVVEVDIEERDDLATDDVLAAKGIAS